MENPRYPRAVRADCVAVLVQIRLEKKRGLPDVPLLIWRRNAAQRAVPEPLSADSMIARAFITTPGLPAERVAVLRVACDRTMTDRNFLAAARNLSAVNPIAGREVEALVTPIGGTPPEIVDQVNWWIRPSK